MEAVVSNIAPAVALPAPAEGSLPAAHDAARAIVSALSPLHGEALRVAFARELRDFAAFKPEKPEFSPDKAERKAQMKAFAADDRSFRSALGVLYRFAEDRGADHKDRHSATVSASGIVTLRRSETLSLRPSKSARVTL